MVETIKEDHIELYNFLNEVKSISNSKHYVYNYCYLCYMAIRLIEMRKVLKDTGRIYFHCDPTMSHYIKIMMDTIFGEDNFRNEIVWKRTWDTGAFKKRSFSFASLQDIIFFIVKTKNKKTILTFNTILILKIMKIDLNKTTMTVKDFIIGRI